MGGGSFRHRFTLSQLELANLVSKNVTVLHPLKRDMSLIVRSSTERFILVKPRSLQTWCQFPLRLSVELASIAQNLSWLPSRVYLPLHVVRKSHFLVFISNIPFRDSWV